jgi:hypothetical protein
LYSNLRFVISASLVGCAGLIGVLALLPPTLEERLLASAELSSPPAPTCNQQNWLHFDRNCLSRRGMPWVANLPAQKEVPSPVESAPEQAAGTQASATVPASTETTASSSSEASASASTETTASSSSEASASASTEASASTQFPPSQSSVPAAQESGQAADVTASRQEAPVSAAIADAPQVATQQSQVTAPQQEASTPPVADERHAVKQRSVTRPRHAAPIATERHVAKPAAETQPPAPKKAAREARDAKPTNEALNAVRKFQDNLRDIPVSSYAADGTRRTIVIRPTSIQDVYYYSAPR